MTVRGPRKGVLSIFVQGVQQPTVRFLETAIKRLGDRYQWQEIEEREHREGRAKLQAQLAELPPPADSNVIAFDRTGERLMPIATIIRETTPEHQSALIKHIVERVTVTDGAVTGIELRPEARPFCTSLAMAPPDGRGALTAKPEEKLAAYL
jgi:hypothetical protein